jgi:hypothetical protein
MSDTFILAFIITPVVVSALGWGAVFLHEWLGRREDRREAERR